MPNSDFYVVSATVIPVFFLALTLQGKQFEEAEKLMQTLTSSFKKLLDQVEKDIAAKSYSRDFWKIISSGFAVSVIYLITLALLLISVLGEALAVWALYNEKANSETRVIVLTAILSLTCSIGLLLFFRLQILWNKFMTIFALGFYVRLMPLIIRGVISTLRDNRRKA